MSSSPESIIPSSATLTLWRVFGLADDFSDRPKPYWTTDAPIRRFKEDSIAVMIGDVPDELITIIRQWRAQIRGQLNSIVGNVILPDQRIQMYHEDLSQLKQPPEFMDEPYVAWLTVCMRRSIDVSFSNSGELDWGPNIEQLIDAMRRFEEEGNPVLDCAVASVIAASNGLNVRHLRFAQRRPYLTALGKAAITIPIPQLKIKDSGIVVGRNDGWDVAPTDQITEAISSITSTPITKKVSKLIGQPMSWLGLAMGEVDDDLRRFTFAFAGLELLVTQVEKNNRNKLIEAISSLDVNLPVADLLWPSTNEDYVWRNLVFRFAATATIYSPETAAADVATFRPIAQARNNLFHGSEQTITRELSIACTGLLRKYVGLVAAQVTSGPAIGEPD